MKWKARVTFYWVNNCKGENEFMMVGMIFLMMRDVEFSFG